HAQMRDQHCAVIQMHQQIFRAAGERGEGAALEPYGKVFRKGKTQIGTAQRHFIEVCPFHRGLEPAAHCFNFWQFWHDQPPLSKGLSMPLGRASVKESSDAENEQEEYEETQ